MKVHEGVYCGLLLLAELFTTQRLLYGFLHVGIGCTKRTADDLKVVILWLPGSAGNLIGFIAYHAPADRRPIKIRKPGAQGILFVDDALLSRIVAPGIVCNRRGNRRGSAYACIFKRRGRFGHDRRFYYRLSWRIHKLACGSECVQNAGGILRWYGGGRHWRNGRWIRRNIQRTLSNSLQCTTARAHAARLKDGGQRGIFQLRAEVVKRGVL